VKTPRFPRGFAKTALEIARQSGVHSREAGGALADGKVACPEQTTGLAATALRGNQVTAFDHYACANDVGKIVRV
jgi:hypothetical protein